MRLNLAFVVQLMLAAVFGSAAAAFDGPPDTGGEPLEIAVQVVIVDVDGVDDASQSFEASVYYELTWRDPRLANVDADSRVPASRIWRPQVGIANKQRSWNVMPEHISVQPDGTVSLRRHVWGSFSQPLDLRKFPFDEQEFSIVILSSAELDEIRLVPHPDLPSVVASTLSVPDWRVIDQVSEGGPATLAETVDPVPSFRFAFTAARLSQYYVLTMILPLVVIVSMSFLTFWISSSGFVARIGTASTSMLTIITYRAAAVQVLPRTNYFTDIDIFIAGCTLLVFAALLIVVFAIALERLDRTEEARLIDLRTRYLFPVAFIAIAAATFWDY